MLQILEIINNTELLNKVLWSYDDYKNVHFLEDEFKKLNIDIIPIEIF